jgi:hypothetical protein
MAKRVRGSSRPVGRRPAGRSARPAGESVERRLPPPSAAHAESLVAPSSLTPDEVARAAELEARIVAEERTAEEAQRRMRNRGRSIESSRSLEPLAVRAADEYAYVRRDVVRIARIGAFLLATLGALHVLINVTGTISI